MNKVFSLSRSPFSKDFQTTGRTSGPPMPIPCTWKLLLGKLAHGVIPMSNLNLDEISFSVRKNKNLVQEYLKIIDEYKERNYVLDELVRYEVKIETLIQQIARSMTE